MRDALAEIYRGNSVSGVASPWSRSVLRSPLRRLNGRRSADSSRVGALDVVTHRTSSPRTISGDDARIVSTDDWRRRAATARLGGRRFV